MAMPTKRSFISSGTRIGSLIWIDTEKVMLPSGEHTIIVTARQRVTNGEIIGREVVEGREIINSLRHVASSIEEALASMEPQTDAEEACS